MLLDPSVLPDVYTWTYISDGVNVIDESSGNSIVAISNVTNVSFSVHQPNVVVSVVSNKVIFTGSYRSGNTENIVYLDKPNGCYGITPAYYAYSYDSVPPEKTVFWLNTGTTDDITVTHNFTVNYTAGGNGTFTIDRTVKKNITAAYNFLINYYQLTSANSYHANTYNVDATYLKADDANNTIDTERYNGGY